MILHEPEDVPETSLSRGLRAKLATTHREVILQQLRPRGQIVRISGQTFLQPARLIRWDLGVRLGSRHECGHRDQKDRQREEREEVR